MPSECAHKPHRHERLERSLLHGRVLRAHSQKIGIARALQLVLLAQGTVRPENRRVSFTKIEQVGDVEIKRNTPDNCVG